MLKKTPVAVCDGYNVYIKNENTRKERHYIYIDGFMIWLHRYLAEKYIRPLKKGEIIHHIDFNHLNNSIKNLKIMTRAEHIRIHKPVLGYRFTDEQKRNLSDAHMGHIAWNRGLRGFKHSEKSRANMSRAQKGRKITWGEKIAKSKTKVTKEALLQFLKNNQNATMQKTKDYFNLKSNSPIFKHGGLRRLRKEAVG